MGVEEELLLDDGSKKAAEPFICSICTEVCGDVLRQNTFGGAYKFVSPLLLKPCDHNFCKTCIQEWMSKKKTCPKCNTEITSAQSLFENKFATQIYQKLRIRCRIGCDWKGTIAESAAHMSTCPKSKLKCVLCKQQVLRANMSDHMDNHCPHRAVNCKYCKELVRFSSLKVHYSTCREFKVPCSCGNMCPRKMIVQHCLIREGIVSMNRRNESNAGTTNSAVRRKSSSPLKDKRVDHTTNKMRFNVVVRNGTKIASNNVGSEDEVSNITGHASTKNTLRPDASNASKIFASSINAKSMSWNERMAIKQKKEAAKEEKSFRKTMMAENDLSKMTLAQKLAMKKKFALK
eukprot:jgi/Bigna1/80432/fgenesh1_pg.71_\